MRKYKYTKKASGFYTSQIMGYEVVIDRNEDSNDMQWNLSINDKYVYSYWTKREACEALEGMDNELIKEWATDRGY